jgi:hypothetical protein
MHLNIAGHVVELDVPDRANLIQQAAAEELNGPGDARAIVATFARSSAVSSLVNRLAPA